MTLVDLNRSGDAVAWLFANLASCAGLGGSCAGLVGSWAGCTPARGGRSGLGASGYTPARVCNSRVQVVDETWPARTPPARNREPKGAAVAHSPAVAGPLAVAAARPAAMEKGASGGGSPSMLGRREGESGWPGRQRRASAGGAA